MLLLHNPCIIMVGATGFEPATPITPRWCATELRYAPTTRSQINLPILPETVKINKRSAKIFWIAAQNHAAMTIAIPIVTPAALHTSYFTLHTSTYQNSENFRIADPHQKCE